MYIRYKFKDSESACHGCIFYNPCVMHDKCRASVFGVERECDGIHDIASNTWSGTAYTEIDENGNEVDTLN